MDAIVGCNPHAADAQGVGGRSSIYSFAGFRFALGRRISNLGSSTCWSPNGRTTAGPRMLPAARRAFPDEQSCPDDAAELHTGPTVALLQSNAVAKGLHHVLRRPSTSRRARAVGGPGRWYEGTQLGPSAGNAGGAAEAAESAANDVAAPEPISPQNLDERELWAALITLASLVGSMGPGPAGGVEAEAAAMDVDGDQASKGFDVRPALNAFAATFQEALLLGSDLAACDAAAHKASREAIEGQALGLGGVPATVWAALDVTMAELGEALRRALAPDGAGRGTAGGPPAPGRPHGDPRAIGRSDIVDAWAAVGELEAEPRASVGDIGA
jgi:hypothetical protein